MINFKYDYFLCVIVAVFIHSVGKSCEAKQEEVSLNVDGPANGGKGYSDVVRCYDQLLDIRLNSTIHMINKINDKDMEMELQLILFAFWMDKRLSDGGRSSNLTLHSINSENYKNKIWTPELHFPNEKVAYDYYAPPSVFVTVFKNGSVRYIKRITLTLSCPMNFASYPFDTQVCSIQMASRHNNVLLVDIALKRKFYHFFMKYYLPVLSIVFISWIPFWLSRILILRISIAIITCLFLSWHYTTQSNELMVSYLTALDVWKIINFVFVLSAASESFFISYMIQLNKPQIKRIHPDVNEEFEKKRSYNCPEKRQYLEVLDEQTQQDLEIMQTKTDFRINFVKVQKEVKILDAASRLLFVSAYFIFIFYYWILIK